jgi:hypothetical protein
MTTDTRTDEQIALDKLANLARTERALDMVVQEVADSLGLKNRKAVDTYVSRLKDDIKAYLMDASDPNLFEGEFQWGARLQPRAGQPTYDLVTLSQRAGAGDIFIEAARAGVLRVDPKALDRFIDNAGATWAETINRMKMPGKGTVALITGPEA